MERFAKVLADKKGQSKSKKPKYGLRKLSVGFVSCMLGVSILACPAFALEQAPSADNSDAQKTHELAEDPVTTDKSVVEEPKVEETGETAVAVQDKPVEESTPAIEISETDATDTKVLATNTETAAATITDIEGSIDGASVKDVKTVKPLGHYNKDQNEDMILESDFNFKVPDTVKGGDSFEVKISDNVNLHGVSQTAKAENLMYNGQVLARAEIQPDGRTIKYVFTDYVSKIADVKMKISLPLFIDKDNVPNDREREKIEVTVDGTPISKELAVKYYQDHYYKDESKGEETLGGIANIDEVTDESFIHTIYVNTNNQKLSNSILEIENQDSTNGVNYNEDVKKSVKVYRLQEGKKLTGSFKLNLEDLEDVTKKATIEINDLFGPAKLLININQKDDFQPYIVTYKGVRKPSTAAKTLVKFGAGDKTQTNGHYEGKKLISDNDWSWTNEVVFDKGSADATGEEIKVYRLGDRVWYDENENGIQDEGEKSAQGVYVSITINNEEVKLKTDENGEYIFNNLPNGEYEVRFSNFNGYKITQANVGDNAKNSDGELINGTVIAKGMINGADNLTVDLGLIALPGSFQEHHIYQTVGEDGKVIESETITEDGQESSGNKDAKYTTSKKDKEGYKLIRIEKPVEDPTFNEDGSEAQGNFKPGKKQEITYVYQKQIKSVTPTPKPAPNPTPVPDTTPGEYTGFYSSRTYSDPVEEQKVEVVKMIPATHQLKALPKTSDVKSAAAPIAATSLLTILLGFFGIQKSTKKDK